MHFLYIVSILAILFFAFYKVINPVNSPDFKLMGLQSDEKLMLNILDLAGASKNTKKRGAGLSVRLIERNVAGAFKVIRKKASAGTECFDFEYWIYDNYYKIREAVARQKKNLFRYSQLPHVESISDNLPRMYKLVQLIVKATGGGYTEALLASAVESYNAVAPLTFQEINNLRPLLEFALLEYIAIFCSKSIVINGKISGAKKDCRGQKIDLSSLGFNSYVFGMEKYADPKVKHGFSVICEDNGLGMHARIDNFYRQISGYNGHIQAAVTNLHKVIEITDEFVLGLSPLYQMLEKNGEIYFAENTLATKSVYLFNISKKARAKDISELALARQLIDKAVYRNIDIAELILPVNQSKLSMRLYIYSLLIISLGIAAIIGVFLLPKIWWAVIAAYPVIFGSVIFFAREALNLTTKRRYLPRKAIKEKDLDKCKTMILFSRLVADESEIDDAFVNLETVAYANNEKVFSYGVLFDLPASGSESFDERELGLIARIKERYDALDKKSGYNIFVRHRKPIPGGKKFQGWEKKRGALIELNNLIIDGKNQGFHTILGDTYNVKYIIALDSDTLLNSGFELVQIMEHPYNKRHNVVSLSITNNPNNTAKTPFARFMSGASGIDNYSNPAADFDFDVFGLGNYTGKGIYRVKEFNEKISGMFMDNRIVSHDFIEGAAAGCANVPEKAMDNFPSNFSSYITRQQRWLRGDWQLLPYLFGKVKNRDGQRIKNPIRPIDKWHIFCNMMAGLVPVSSAVVLIISVFFEPAVILLLLAFALNILYVINGFRVFTLKNFWSAVLELSRQLFAISCLPVIAYNNLKSILLTLWRLMVKKKLLEWKVFAHSRSRVNFLPNIVAAAGIIAAAVLMKLSFVYYIIAGIFLAGIVLDVLMSREYKEKSRDGDLKEILSGVAAKTWKYFEMQLTEENNYLPSDNYQEYLDKGLVKRTSPTNIGMALSAVISAFECDIIDEKNKDFYIEQIVSAIEKLPKWHGNIYNWIDIITLAPLEPKYVSTVDCGNFLVCMTLAAQYVTGSLKYRIEKLISETEIERLYDERRGLFLIGYNDSNKTADKNHYDLIGSESALTYLISIGLGKVDKAAWNNLSRQCVRYKGKLLYSWTGGAFEYLMCPLYFRFPKWSMLHSSSKNAVRSNIKYARKMELPFWGVSESQYNAIDDNGLYQYRAFGVPGIALSNASARSIAAPYASFLALPFYPQEVKANIYRMSEKGMIGELGCYESIDGDNIQKAYMTHHQGMILTAAAGYMCSGNLIRKLQDSPAVRAAELLLTQGDTCGKSRKKLKELSVIERDEDAVITVSGIHDIPKINLLSNGKYGLVSDETGRAFSVFDGYSLYGYDGKTGGYDIFVKTGGKTFSILSGKAEYSSFKTTYHYSGNGIAAVTGIYVLPGSNGEVREVKLKNLKDSNAEIDLFSCAELLLAKKEDYLSHRVYSNMFVWSEYLENENMLVFRSKKNDLIFAHYFDTDETVYESNRSNIFMRGEKLPSFGSVLDPAASGKLNVKLEPYGEKTVRIYNLVSYDLEYIKRLGKITRSEGFIEKIKGACYSISKKINVKRRTADFASKLLYRPSAVDPQLAGSGININIPLITIEFDTNSSAERLKIQLNELKKLFKFGISFNTAIIYTERHSYFHMMSDALSDIIDDTAFRHYMDGRSTLTLINRAGNKNAAEKALACRTDMEAYDNPVLVPSAPVERKPYPNTGLAPLKFDLELGIGGFLEDGSYAMDISDSDTPSPWSNIIANENFGTLITESGGGYTYHINSRENKLTKWRNDYVSDKPSEAVVLGEGGLLWSITKKPLQKKCSYQVVHSFGYSEFYNDYNGFLSKETQFIHENTKYYIIEAENRTAENRTLDIMLALDVLLGNGVDGNGSRINTAYEDDIIMLKNPVSGSQIYVQSDLRADSISFYKEAYEDRYGNIARNSDLTEKGSDPGPAYSVKLKIAAGETGRVVFAAGAQRDADFENCRQHLNKAKIYYSSLSKIEMLTGDKSFDHLIKWLPYQVLCSRFNAKAGFYQAGGAIGFRDQLQDCLALLYVEPALVRKHILECAAHQFEAGDVQHWWHPPAVGVRTKITDDRLYLPLALSEYIGFTGDYGIMAERVPYLENMPIPKDKHSIYASAKPTGRTGSILEHCVRAITSSLNFGDNGLMLMGGGDWNDAMDMVGINGLGTTVWGSMFLYHVIGKFLPFVNNIDDKRLFMDSRDSLREAVDIAWDGEWYVRAYTDEGLALGSIHRKECQIDLITQSWAKLSGIGQDEKIDLALYSAGKRLVDPKNKIVKLLAPPFKEMKNIGYISDYPEGIRENGGQYTHAAVWYIMSMFECGKTEFAYDLLKLINPVNHALTKEGAQRYSVEPYVISADVYAGEYAGRGGWSWYTGAASWMYKCLIENLFGIKQSKNSVRIEPNLPKAIQNAKIKLRGYGADMEIDIDNTAKDGEWHAVIDGIKYNTSAVTIGEDLSRKSIVIKRFK